MIKEKLFTALGAVSMCWDPTPSNQVFDSVAAKRIGEDCLREIEEEVANFAIDFVFWLMLNCELIKDEETEENVLWRYDSEDYIIDTLLEIFKREKGL